MNPDALQAASSAVNLEVSVSNAPGVIVESIAAGSTAEQAGLLPGDCLLAWNDQPLASPFLLEALEENTFGKETLVLTLERNGQRLETEVATGKSGIEVRPVMAESLLAMYQEGRRAQETGDREEAGKLWKEAAELAEEDCVRVWLYIQAGAAYEQGNHWSAAQKVYITVWEQAKAVLEAAAPIPVLGGLGRCAQRQNDYPNAEQWLEQANQQAGEQGWLSWQARILNNLGQVAWTRGDLSLAQHYYERSLLIRERLAPGSLDVAASLNNLGNVACKRGDLSLAQRYYERSLQIIERLAPESLNVATSLNNLGIVAYDRGDLSLEQHYHERSLLIRERLAPELLIVATSLNNLGNVSFTRGDLSLAQHYCERSLQIIERLAPESLSIVDTLSTLGQTALAHGDFQQARNHFLHAVEIVEQQRGRIAIAENRSLLLSQHTDKYWGLLQSQLNIDHQEPAFATVERCRARSLVEMLAERHVDFSSQAPAELLQKQQELDRQRYQAFTALAQLSAADESQVQAPHKQLLDLERQQQALAAAIRKASPAYATLQYPQPLDLKCAQKALDAGTLLLTYMVGEDESYLFAVTRKTLDVFTLPIRQKQLQEQVQQFRKSLDLMDLQSDYGRPSNRVTLCPPCCWLLPSALLRKPGACCCVRMPPCILCPLLPW